MKFSFLSAKSILAVSLALFMSTGAHASSAAFSVVSGGNFFTGPATLGYEFTVNSATTVTDLGIFDAGSAGLLATQSVGVWTSEGTLLASTTIAVGTGTTIDGFVYQSLSTALDLEAGTFRIGSTNGGVSVDGYTQFAGVTNNTALVTHGTSFVSFGASLTRPTTTFGDSGAYFGPNMIVEATVISAVPIPAALPLLLAGLGGLGFIRRQSKRRDV
jgi:hypothetical protein